MPITTPVAALPGGSKLLYTAQPVVPQSPTVPGAGMNIYLSLPSKPGLPLAAPTTGVPTSDVGARVQQMTNWPGYHCWWPRWAPDGNSFLYLRNPIAQAGGVSYDHDFPNAQLWVANADGTEHRQIGGLGIDYSTGQMLVPQWSPSGQWIVHAGGPGVGVSVIWVRRPDGSGLTNIPVAGQVNNLADTAFFADPDDGGTQHIAYTFNLDIWTIKMDGTNAFQVTTDGASNQNFDPVPLPAGANIGLPGYTRPIAMETRFSATRFDLRVCEGIKTRGAINMAAIISDNNINSKHVLGVDGFLYGHWFQSVGGLNFGLRRALCGIPSPLLQPIAGGAGMVAGFGYPDIWPNPLWQTLA